MTVDELRQVLDRTNGAAKVFVAAFSSDDLHQALSASVDVDGDVVIEHDAVNP